MKPAPPVTSARWPCWPAAVIGRRDRRRSRRTRSRRSERAEVPVDQVEHLAECSPAVLMPHAQRRCRPRGPWSTRRTSARSLLITQRSRPARRLGRGAVRRPGARCRKPSSSADALVEQQPEVVAQELSAPLDRRRRRPALAARQRVGLRQDPRIAQHAAAHQHAADARPQPVRDLIGLHAVAAAEDRNVEVARRRAPPDPSRPARCRTARPSGREW